MTSAFEFFREGIGGGGEVQEVLAEAVDVAAVVDDDAVVGSFGVLSHDEARGTRIGSSGKPLDLSIEDDLLCRANLSIFLAPFSTLPVDIYLGSKHLRCRQGSSHYMHVCTNGHFFKVFSKFLGDIGILYICLRINIPLQFLCVTYIVQQKISSNRNFIKKLRTHQNL